MSRRNGQHLSAEQVSVTPRDINKVGSLWWWKREQVFCLFTCEGEIAPLAAQQCRVVVKSLGSF